VDLRKLCLEEVVNSPNPGVASATWREICYNANSPVKLPGRLSAAYLAGKSEQPCVADEFLTMYTHGVPPEEYKTPTAAAAIAARPFRISEPVAVDFSNPEAVRLVLSAERPIPVMIGFTVFESFDDGPGTDRMLKLPAPDEAILGGWALIVVGYEQRGWIVRNSQGPEWGAGGYAIMPYGYESYWFDCWTV
jgi:hypothetical protein